MQTIIERELDVQLVLSVERSIPVPARLTYRSDDPYAVHITFHIGSDAPVHWTFARELLVEGIFRPAGQGDVRVWPEVPEECQRLETRVCLSLRSPDGDALLRIPGHTVAAWLERTMRVVPPGREARDCDLDGELRALLASPFTTDAAPYPAEAAPFAAESASFATEGAPFPSDGEAGRPEPEERHDRAGEPAGPAELPPGLPRAPGLADLSRLTDLTDLVGLQEFVGRCPAEPPTARHDVSRLGDLADLPERAVDLSPDIPAERRVDLSDISGVSDLPDRPDRGDGTDRGGRREEPGEAAG